MYQNAIYICISWYSKISWFPVKKCWCQQNSRGLSRDSYFLDLLWVRYNCAKFHHCRICVTGFREGGLFALPPSISEQPRKSPSWTGLKSSFLILDLFLKTGVTSVNLNEAGNCEEEMATLNWKQIHSAKIIQFNIKFFTGVSISCVAFLGFRLSISFITVLLSMLEKWKLLICWEKCEMDINTRMCPYTK